MIIDAHTHVGRNELINARMTELLASMESAGIDKALVFAGGMNASYTEELLREIAPYRDRLYAVGSISPLYTLTPSPQRPALNEVEEWLKRGFIYGLKFYPGYEYFYPADDCLRPYLELLEAYDRPTIFHSGDLFNRAARAKLKYAHPLHIDDLASEMPKLKIIIAHCGWPWVTDAAEVCRKNVNVFADCSGFVYGKFAKNDIEHFEEMIRVFARVAGGVGKILFGTDWPIGDQLSYLETCRFVFDSQSPDCKKIFFGNAIQLFKLDV